MKALIFATSDTLKICHSALPVLGVLYTIMLMASHRSQCNRVEPEYPSHCLEAKAIYTFGPKMASLVTHTTLQRPSYIYQDPAEPHSSQGNGLPNYRIHLDVCIQE